jgi:hypothetical protein
MDLAQFSEGIKKAGTMAEGLAQRFGLTAQNLQRVSIGVGAAFAAVATSIAVGVKVAIDRADELSKLSQKIGVPIEQLSSLAYAADLAGVPIEGLGNGIKKLSINLQEAASGNLTATASRALTALGVSATDANGKLRSTSEVLPQLADKFAEMKDGAGKTALAVAIFGKQGAELIPLLNGGATALNEMTDRAKSMGLVLDTQTGKAAEEFNDRLSDLAYGLRGLFTQVSARLLPVINDLTQAFADWVRGSGDGVTAANSIADGIFSIYERALVTITAIEKLGNSLGAFYRSAKALFTDEVVKDIQDSNARINAELDAALKERLRKIEEFRNKTGAAAAGAGGGKSDKGKKDPPAVPGTQAIAKAQGELNRAIQEGVSLAKQIIPPYDKLEKQLAALDAAYKAGKISAQELSLAQAKLIEDANIAFEGGAALVEKNRTPYENMRAELEKLERQYQATAISATALAQAQQAAIVAAATAYVGFASDVGQSLLTVFGKSKGIAIAVGTIDAIGAGLKALAAYPPPFSYIAAAAALAAGLAQVARIRSVSSGGGGGGGGSAGGGSAAAAASKPASAAAATPGSPGVTQGVTINLTGDTFGRKQVLGLISEINGAVRDGAQIITSRT